YDSVFVISNPIFDKVNIRSEFANVTMFLPSNQVIDECFNDLGVLYEQFGKDFLQEDSLVAYNWIKEAIFYDRLVEEVNGEDFTSAFGRLWRPQVQKVNHELTRMRNGRVNDITKLKITNNVDKDMIKKAFHNWESVYDAEKKKMIK